MPIFIKSEYLPDILHLNDTYDTIFELYKISWREGDHKKGKGSPYILPLITVKSHKRTESLSVTPLGYLNFKKSIFRTMQTMRKQFPVNWLTTGRFSAPKRGGVNKLKKWLPKVEGQCGGCVLDKLSFFNEEPTIETR